jgi:hypothetical protein
MSVEKGGGCPNGADVGGAVVVRVDAGDAVEVAETAGEARRVEERCVLLVGAAVRTHGEGGGDTTGTFDELGDGCEYP